MSDTVGLGGEGDSRRRTAASMDSSSKGLRLCLTPAVMIAVFVAFTRGRICVPRFSFREKIGWLDLRHSQLLV